MKQITDARRWLSLLILLAAAPAFAVSGAFEDRVYETGRLKPVDSTLKVSVGEIIHALEKVSGKSN